MDISKYNLETALRKNLTNNVSKMSSVTSKVSLSPPLNTKKNSDFLDDTMVCEDDWLDYDDDDDDEDKDEENQSVNAESPPLVVTEEIPPKDDRPSSTVTFGSPKRKRTKFHNFDELLQNLNFDILNLNFTKLLLFLESTNKEMIFLFTLEEYEEFFQIVLLDIHILKSRSLDACYRDMCDKILEAATGYILTYVYEYKTEFQKTVMVIKKEPINMMDQSEEDTSTVSWSQEPTTASRVVNTKVQHRTISPDTISSGFKIHCLRTMLAFIKYDETKSKQFPELSPDQAVYMESLLESDGSCNDFEKNLEVKQLYRALWEAMKIYSLKYEFKIKCVDSWCGKKNLKFKKIPRQKSGTDGDSNQTVSLMSETENLEIQPDDEESWFAKPEIPNSVQQNPTRLTKRMLQNQIKLENEDLFIKRLPPQFVSETLNSILEFLLDDGKDKLVFLPKNQPELCFHRKVIDWCRTWYCVAKFGEEFERIHHKIFSLLPRFEIQSTKRRANKTNEITGVREVVYIKKWHKSNSGSLDSVQSASKKKRKKKVNLQNALELAGTEQIQLTSVVDLNQSLRNKKKNKKQKKAKSKRANAVARKAASSKGNTSKTWTDDSSSACSSRSTSQDRAKLISKPQSVAKKPIDGSKSGRRHEAINRRYEEMNRKEQLKEALSVPVQSDKAVRMMRGMGWSGGALGARGVGITEPLMPKLDITRGAGLGHIRGSRPVTTSRKSKEPKTAASWVSENQTDSIMKIVELPKQWESNVDLPKPNVELSKPNVELTKPNVELSKPNVELTKPNVELPNPNDELSKPVISQNFSRQEFLNSVLEFTNTDETQKTLRYSYHNRIPSKAMKFVKNFVAIVNRRKVNYSIFSSEEFNIYTQIQFKFKKLPFTFLEAKFSRDVKTLEIIKIMPAEQTPTQQMLSELNMQTELKTATELNENTSRDNQLQSTRTNSEIITEDYVKSFIISTESQCNTPKANAILKFKVLFLFNILNFVKSLNEESEVIFNKILTLKEKSYIQNIVDEVNMRINFGSTPAETKLCNEIKENIADAFLGAMFNHQYTVVTLNKYFRFKRLNRPDNAVKRKCQTSINLDIYKSETVSQANVNTSYELTNKENNNKVAVNSYVAENEIKFAESCSKVAENWNKLVDNCSKVSENKTSVAESCSKVNENCNKVAENNRDVENSNKSFENKNIFLESSEDDIISYDSDESSIEEYRSNNAKTKVPRLPPGEEGVNMSGFLYLYEKGKTNPTDIKDASYINNASASKMTEKVNNKNNIGNGNVVIDNNDNQIIDMKRDGNTNTSIKMAEKEINSIDSEIKRSEMVTANNVRIDEVLANTKDRVQRRSRLAANWEDILRDDVFVFTGNTSNKKNDTDVIMKDDVIEMMEVISITDNDVTNKKEISNKGTEIEEKNCIITSDAQKVKEETNNLDSKTDCDILTKEKIVLRGNDCDTQSVAVKIGTEKDVPNCFNSTDPEIKTVRIVHSNHPLTKLTNEKITEIQRHISNSIILTIQLPLLKCHGVQNGAIIYTCHNEKSYDWLQNTFGVTSCVKVLNTEDVTKMVLKFCCFFDCHFLYVCKMIELYNKEVSTKQWVVEKTEREGDHIIFIVRMDTFSSSFIQKSGFALFAGVDKVQFSPIWE